MRDLGPHFVLPVRTVSHHYPAAAAACRLIHFLSSLPVLVYLLLLILQGLHLVLLLA